MSERDNPRLAELDPLVRGALSHLYDGDHLETHPLAHALPEDLVSDRACRGQALQRALISAIEALRSSNPRTDPRRAGRGHALLSLRYIEALDIAAVRDRLAVSRSQYHADHRRAVAAVASLLRQRWRLDQVSVQTSAASRRARSSSTEPPLTRTNLPLELTSFIGRRRELAAVKRLLRTSHLLTLTGPGGCGKTRLALRAAVGVHTGFPDGVWLVDLARMTPASAASPGDRFDGTDAVTDAIALALGLIRTRRERGMGALVQSLRHRRLLLVLDNCEHVALACARVSDALLQSCAGVRILATSRQPLRARGEFRWPVPPLSVPTDGAKSSVTEVAGSESGRLFAQRAAMVHPAFHIEPSNAPAVGRICRRLDGLPLAIELAAAWVGSLGPHEIAARIVDRADLLADASHTLPPRQQTLVATLDWSHALLDTPEQVLLRRLAVFVGGWTLDAAVAICSDQEVDIDKTVSLLASLVDRSLVTVEASSAAVRYRLLETVRQYAVEKLGAAGEEMALRTRHRDWYLALSDAARPELNGPRHATWVTRLAVEHDNLQAALAWSRDRGDFAAGLRLAANLGWYWLAGGHLAEGCKWLDTLAGLAAEPTAQRARALCMAALLHRYSGDPAASVRLGEEAATIAQATGDAALADAAAVEVGLAEATGHDYVRANARLEACLAHARARQDVVEVRERVRDLGLVRMAAGQFAAARNLFTESLALAEQTGNDGAAAMALLRLSALDRLEGNLASARAQVEQACELARENRLAYERFWSCLGQQARAEANFVSAEAIFKDVLVRSLARGDQAVVAEQLFCLAISRIAQGQFAEGVALGGVGAAISPFLGSIHTPDLRLETEASLDRARAALSEERFRSAWATGQATTPEACLVRDRYGAVSARLAVPSRPLHKGRRSSSESTKDGESSLISLA